MLKTLRKTVFLLVLILSLIGCNRTSEITFCGEKDDIVSISIVRIGDAPLYEEIPCEELYVLTSDEMEVLYQELLKVTCTKRYPPESLYIGELAIKITYSNGDHEVFTGNGEHGVCRDGQVSPDSDELPNGRQIRRLIDIYLP